MNRLPFLLFCVIFSMLNTRLSAQNIGINGSGSLPNNSAGLDVDFTNKGLLLPRIALTSALDATTIASPATSLLIYNTSTAGVSPNNVTPGYYYWSGSAWTRLATVGATGTDWTVNGNSGTNPITNFIGTTDNNDLVVKANNNEVLRVAKTNRLGVNESNPNSSIHVRTFMNADLTNPFDGIKLISPMLAPAYNSGTILGIDNGTMGGGFGVNAQLWNFESGFLRFGTDDVERVRLDQFGSMGLNETTLPSTFTMRPFINGATGADFDGIRILHPFHAPSITEGLMIGVDDMGQEATLQNNQPGDLNIESRFAAIKFKTNNNERMRILANGTVGIGHTAPLSTLTIQDNVGVQPGLTVTSAYFAPGTNGMLFGLNQGTQTNGKIWNHMNGDIEIGTNNTEFIRLTNIGNVGIGTASPTEKLDISNGNIKLESGFYMKNDLGNNMVGSNLSGTVIGDGGASNPLKIFTSGGITGGINFITPGGTDDAKFTTSGYLGLGTTSPTERLEIIGGNIKLENGYYMKNDLGNNMVGSNLSGTVIGDGGASNPLKIFTSGGFTGGINFITPGTTNDAKFTSSGNLGLGTTSPTERLEIIGGNIKLENGYYLKNDLGNNMVGSNVSGTVIGDGSASTQLKIYTSGGFSGGIQFITPGGSDDAKLTSSGFLGLGTTSPTERLEVNGKVKIGAYTMPNTDGTLNQILKTNGTGTLTWSNDNSGSGTVTSVALSMPSIFSVSGSPVTGSGTLTATLATQNANTIFAGPSSGGAATPTFRTLVAADIPTLTGYIQNAAVGNNFATGQAASFDITGNAEINGTLEVNGNVGIGTTTPTDKLTVQTATNTFGLTHTDGTIVTSTYAGGAINGGYIGTKSNHPFGLYVNNGTATVYVSTANNVGIGTTTTNSLLEVNGPIAMKVKTAQVAGTNNPDNTGEYWFYTSGTGVITLPMASTCTNRVYVILNNTGAARTTSAYRDLTLTNQTTIANNNSLWVVSDGTNWQQIK